MKEMKPIHALIIEGEGNPHVLGQGAEGNGAHIFVGLKAERNETYLFGVMRLSET